MISNRGNFGDAWSGCKEQPHPCLFPVLSWWPCILPRGSLLASLSLLLLCKCLHGWPDVPVLEWWQICSPLHKQGAREAVTWARCWVHLGTWFFPLLLLVHLHCVKHAGEAPWQQRVSVGGWCIFQVGWLTLDWVWLLSWGRTSISEGQKLISLALPAQTYPMRVKLDYLAKTLWANTLLNGKHLIRAAAFLVAQSRELGAPIRSVASSGLSHLLSLEETPCPRPSARWWGSLFRRWELQGASCPLSWICGVHRTCMTTRSRLSSNIRDCGEAACGRALALQSAGRISPFLGCQVGAKDVPGLTQEFSYSSAQFSCKSKSKYLKPLCEKYNIQATQCISIKICAYLLSK